MTTRWPAEIIDYKQFQARVDFDPQSDPPRAYSVYIRRTDKCTHDIDDDMDELSRRISRVIRGLPT